jgi:hypothetical protein
MFSSTSKTLTRIAKVTLLFAILVASTLAIGTTGASATRPEGNFNCQSMHVCLYRHSTGEVIERAADGNLYTEAGNSLKTSSSSDANLKDDRFNWCTPLQRCRVNDRISAVDNGYSNKNLCLYTDKDFRGDWIMVPAGQVVSFDKNGPHSHFNDKISSFKLVDQYSC